MQSMNNQFSSSIHTSSQFQTQSTSQSSLTPQQLFTQLANNSPNPVCLNRAECEHRFVNVHCPAESAVKVQVGDESKFLHANTVKTSDGSTFIAAQAPHTDSARELYLKTAMESASVIVDLTNETDNKVGDPRVDAHYPKEIGEQQTFSSITITLRDQKVDSQSNLSISRYHLIDASTGKEREITRINYSGWKDFHGSELDELKNLISVVNQHASESENAHLNPMVNCRAGVGRTGTFITAAAMHNLASQGKLSGDRIDVLSSTILESRAQRGPMFVQTDAQLATLMEFASQLENETPEEEVAKAKDQPATTYSMPPTEQFASLRSIQGTTFTPPPQSPFQKAKPSMLNEGRIGPLPHQQNAFIQQHVFVPIGVSTPYGPSTTHFHLTPKVTQEKVSTMSARLFRELDDFQSLSPLSAQEEAAKENTLGLKAVRHHGNILGVNAVPHQSRTEMSEPRKASEMESPAVNVEELRAQALRDNILGVQAVRRNNGNTLGLNAARPENRVHLSEPVKPPEMTKQADSVERTQTDAMKVKKNRSFSLLRSIKMTAIKISNFLFGPKRS